MERKPASRSIFSRLAVWWCWTVLVNDGFLFAVMFRSDPYVSLMADDVLIDGAVPAPGREVELHMFAYTPIPLQLILLVNGLTLLLMLQVAQSHRQHTG